MMREPGIYADIPEADYHRDPDSLSQSGAKLILKAPALYRHEQEHPTYKAAWDYGSAAHALVLGKGIESIYVAPFDNWQTKQAQTERRIAHDEGLSPILPADWQQVCEMADVLSSHSLAMELLAMGDAEVSAFCEDEATGVMRRARFDFLAPRIVVDYKSAISVNPLDLAGRYGVVKKLSYDMQAAWYLDIARDLGLPIEEFAFIFQMKEPPYLVTVAVLRDSDLHEARDRNRRALERFRDCTESGLWPGFLPDTAYAWLSLTDQTYTEEWISA